MPLPPWAQRAEDWLVGGPSWRLRLRTAKHLGAVGGLSLIALTVSLAITRDLAVGFVAFAFSVGVLVGRCQEAMLTQRQQGLQPDPPWEVR